MTNLQVDILSIFSTIPDSTHFYLTGGTALADFYLAHRKSYDLDIFTNEKSLILPVSYELEEKLKKNFSLNVLRRFESFVEFEVKKEKESTRIQLAYDSPFKFKDRLDSNLGIKVISYDDLTVDKLLAFYGRTEPRDAIDLFFILQTKDFWELLKLASIKDPGFDLYWMAIALKKVENFPDEINLWLVDMIKEVDIKKLKNLFSDLALKIMDTIKQRKDNP